MTTAAVVLAAGGSRRFAAGNKLDAPFRGRPLASWAVAGALEAGLDSTYVVVGACEVDVPAEVVVVPNPLWEEGLATSLHAAIAVAQEAGHDAVVVGLADEPFVPPEAWRAVAAAATPVAVALYAGHQGHPVRLGREAWPLLPTTGDTGARELIASRPDLVTRVPCPGAPADIDTVEDLQRWT